MIAKSHSQNPLQRITSCKLRGCIFSWVERSVEVLSLPELDSMIRWIWRINQLWCWTHYGLQWWAVRCSYGNSCSFAVHHALVLPVPKYLQCHNPYYFFSWNNETIFPKFKSNSWLKSILDMMDLNRKLSCWEIAWILLNHRKSEMTCVIDKKGGVISLLFWNCNNQRSK